jgi:4-amino-4-deoxy-L-arabinose transferase-like glycosyltransferase
LHEATAPVTTTTTPAPWKADGVPHETTWLLILVLVGLLLRITFLASFPGVTPDEGLWTTSTKNRLLFGDWFMDGRNHLFLSPVYHLLTWISFWLAGPGIGVARAVSAVAGVASIPLVYLLARRLTGDGWVALAAAAIMAVDPWSIFHSRHALVEAVLVAFVLGSAVLLLGDRRQIALAGVCFAAAILTKVSVLGLGLALGGYLLLRPSREDGRVNTAVDRVMDGALFGLVALGLAALAYWAVAQVDPDRFVEVFRYELRGDHVLGSDEAGTRAGRLAVDPVLSGRSFLEVLRYDPFLVCLGFIGLIIAWTGRSQGRLFLGLWLLAGFGVPFLQTYQPVRYFFPAAPALVVLAAMAVRKLAEGGGTVDRRAVGGILGIVAAYGLAYVAMAFVVTGVNKAAVVDQWVRGNVSRDISVMAASYLAVDPPNRVYGHYLLARDEQELVNSIARHGIRYIIWDDVEWSREMRDVLDRRYRRVETWGFGVVYRVDAPDSGPSPQPIR